MTVSLSITIPTPKILNLADTLECGQAFRWRLSNGRYYGVIQGNLVSLRQTTEGLEVRSSHSFVGSIESVLHSYFRFDDDLDGIYSCIDSHPNMHEAISRYRGMRLLRQDPWECLVSFICSANSNVPRISATMNSLAEYFGDRLELDDYIDYSFPTAAQIVNAGENTLRTLKLGFRAKYVVQAAKRVDDGQLILESLRNLSYQDSKAVLMSIPGVGDKIADCILLFSLDKLEACPIDRWVRRGLEEWYLIEAKLNYNAARLSALSVWGANAGYAQQYMFHHKRLLGQSGRVDS